MLLFCTTQPCRQHYSYIIIFTKQEYFPTSKIITKDHVQGKNFSFKISSIFGFVFLSTKLQNLQYSYIHDFRYMCTFRPFIFNFFVEEYVTLVNLLPSGMIYRRSNNGRSQEINFVYFARHFSLDSR